MPRAKAWRTFSSANTPYFSFRYSEYGRPGYSIESTVTPSPRSFARFGGMLLARSASPLVTTPVRTEASGWISTRRVSNFGASVSCGPHA